MNDSILGTTKKLLGMDPSYTPFDTDVIVAINSAMLSLKQLGVGPEEGYVVTDASDTWSDFMGDDPALASVKMYVYLKVRLTFDTPSSSAATEIYKEQIKEIEWRLTLETEKEGGDESG